MRKSRQRLVIIASSGAVLALALALAAVGLRSTAAFFQTPSQVLAAVDRPDGAVRLGGLVTLGSIRTTDEGVNVFELADDEAAIEVEFAGMLPSLFREGQCVIAEGSLGVDGRFSATRVLAKHDEEYRAPEITSSPRLARSCGSASAPATS
jgi:cytochrome c-type biogenesis protein CcmE